MILAVPLSYAVYQYTSPFVAVAVLLLLGVGLPQVYARFAVAESPPGRD